MTKFDIEAGDVLVRVSNLHVLPEKLKVKRIKASVLRRYRIDVFATNLSSNFEEVFGSDFLLEHYTLCPEHLKELQFKSDLEDLLNEV